MIEELKQVREALEYERVDAWVERFDGSFEYRGLPGYGLDEALALLERLIAAQDDAVHLTTDESNVLHRALADSTELVSEGAAVQDDAAIHEPWLLEQWCGEGGIDGLDPAKTYNVTGTHLREILQAYRKLYAAANVLPSRVQGSGVGDATDTNVGNISQEALDRMKDVISGYRWGENLHETAEAALCVASSQQADEIARLQDKIERLRASAKQLQGESIELREENARHKEIASAIVAAAVMGQYFNNAGFSDEPEAERGGYEIHLHESIVRKAKEILAVDAFLKEKK